MTSAEGNKGRKSEKKFRRRYDRGDLSIGSMSHLGKYDFLVSYVPQS